MEVKNQLLNFSKMCIYQDSDWFNFSLDSVLLANFVTVNKSDKKIIDFATGNAPIPMLLTYRTNGIVYGVEIQKEVYNLAVKSVKENKLEDRIILLNENVNNLVNIFESDTFDVITCNPPYFKINNESNLNSNEIKRNARHESLLTLEDILKVSKKILKNGGKLALVHRPERLIEIIGVMRKYNIEPKKLRLIYPKRDKKANILLIEGVKNGQPGLKIMSPLISHGDNNEYTKEIKDMFGK